MSTCRGMTDDGGPMQNRPSNDRVENPHLVLGNESFAYIRQGLCVGGKSTTARGIRHGGGLLHNAGGVEFRVIGGVCRRTQPATRVVIAPMKTDMPISVSEDMTLSRRL